MLITLGDIRKLSPSFFANHRNAQGMWRFSKTIYQGTGGVYFIGSTNNLPEGRLYYLFQFDVATYSVVRVTDGMPSKYLCIREAMKRSKHNRATILTLANGMQIIWPPNLPLPEEFRDAGK